MGVLPERKKWLANRLRAVAAEEEQRGAKDFAADFRRQATLLEEDLDDPAIVPKAQGRPHAPSKRS
jgi:hypothetical protein